MEEKESFKLKAVYDATFTAYYDMLATSDGVSVSIDKLESEYDFAQHAYCEANTNAIKAEIALQVAKGMLDAAVRFDKKF
jgi:hypothetical protein